MMTTEKKRKKSQNQPVGRWIRVEKRLAIYLRDGQKCLLCSRDLTAEINPNTAEVTLDHIVTRSNGGSNHETNVYTCCKSCNCSRQDTDLAEFAGKAIAKKVAKKVAETLKPFKKAAKLVLA